MVDRIEKGEFVEFTEFPIFDGTQKPGEWGSERVSPTDREAVLPRTLRGRGPVRFLMSPGGGLIFLCTRECGSRVSRK